MSAKGLSSSTILYTYKCRVYTICINHFAHTRTVITMHIWLTHGMQTPRPQRCLLAQIQGLDGTNSSRLPSGNHQSLPFCSSLECADWVSLCQPQHAGLLPPCPHSHSVIKHIIEYYKVITRLLSWISTYMYLYSPSPWQQSSSACHMSCHRNESALGGR